MKQIPLVKLFLVGLCVFSLSTYGYFLVISLLPSQQAPATISWVEAGLDRLNLRENPGNDSPVLRRLQLGERLQLVDEQDNWLEVKDAKGQLGWVYRPFVVYSPPGLQ